MISRVHPKIGDTPITELERYGLSVRTINIMDTSGVRFVWQLIGAEPADLKAVLYYFDKACLRELRAALWNFLNGTPTKTVQECIMIGDVDADDELDQVPTLPAAMH